MKHFGLLLFLYGLCIVSVTPAFAQTGPPKKGIQPLRSDVGINGFTANFHGLSSFTNLENDTLHTNGSANLEIVFHDVRMMSQRLGVGFQVLGSFYTNSNPGHSQFGIKGWGAGPMVRVYPFFTNRFQPYAQAEALFGDNMGVGKLATTANRGKGFRVRLGMRAGFAYRIINNFGLFVEGGPDWESGALFKADARAWQLNIGFDIYRFK
ncbi:MAG TPA: hypothetical protein VE868_07500 [Balneolaceae bacterium]|nr:hypothetical protein [Balneolaceae bacterium]